MDFFNQLTTLELLARLIYGEARGEPYEGQIAVANVAVNRSHAPGWWGTTLRECILHPYQFSCFLPAYNADLVTPDESAWLDCVKIAHAIMVSEIEDNTGGATSYYADTITPPDWAASMTMTCKIGHHLFFR